MIINYGTLKKAKWIAFVKITLYFQAPEFDWSSQTKGLILSSFFYGYLVTQLPGGWLASKIGGNRFVPFPKNNRLLAQSGMNTKGKLDLDSAELGKYEFIEVASAKFLKHLTIELALSRPQKPYPYTLR